MRGESLACLPDPGKQLRKPDGGDFGARDVDVIKPRRHVCRPNRRSEPTLGSISLHCVSYSFSNHEAVAGVVGLTWEPGDYQIASSLPFPLAEHPAIVGRSPQGLRQRDAYDP